MPAWFSPAKHRFPSTTGQIPSKGGASDPLRAAAGGRLDLLVADSDLRVVQDLVAHRPGPIAPGPDSAITNHMDEPSIGVEIEHERSRMKDSRELPPPGSRSIGIEVLLGIL